MRKILENFIYKLVPFSILICTTLIFTNVDIAGASNKNNDNDKLITKISKDYTNKFCNSLAFGLSKESAMNFSNEENKKIFEKKKGINEINKEVLAKEIATSVVESCGYIINMSGISDIEEFKTYYLSKSLEN